MNLAHLRYFALLADTGSFTVAAARANVTQPTLSAGIRRLEDTFGAVLIERGRRATLTAAGARLLPHARTILAEWRAARDETTRPAPTTRIALGVHSSIPAAALKAALLRLRDDVPDAAVELVEGEPSALEQMLARRRIDLWLGALPADADRAVTRAALRARLVVHAASDHVLARRGVCRLADLADLAFAIRPGCEITAEAARAFATRGARPRIVARAADDEKLMAIAASGLAMVLLPDWRRAPGTSQVEIADLAATRRYGFRWRTDRAAAVAPLVDALSDMRWLAPRRGDDPARADAAH
jgi:DNA-binding transcriptional LysR family regulator